MSKVTLSTELPISATAACALARKPQLFNYVVWPVLRVPRMDFPDHIEVGTHGCGRLWWFGAVPAWVHHLTVKQLEPTQIYTNEHGGPVKLWNHRLTFTPLTRTGAAIPTRSKPTTDGAGCWPGYSSG